VDGSGQVHGHKLKNSERFNGLSPAEASKQMVEVLKGQDKGEVATNYSIRVIFFYEWETNDLMKRTGLFQGNVIGVFLFLWSIVILVDGSQKKTRTCHWSFQNH